MKKSRFLVWCTVVASLILLFSRCSKDGLDTYESTENSVYFGMENPTKATKNVFVDTTVFSFGDHEGVTDTIINIKVNALGGFFNRPRPFDFEIVDSLTTAIEGKHFTLSIEGQGVIPANEVCGYIPVRLTFTDDMKDKAMWYVVLQLKPSEEFSLDLKREYVDVSNDQYVELTRHWVGVTSRIQKPQRWYQVEQYFLDYSSDKYKLINEICHLEKKDWDDIKFYVAEAYWVAVRNYLQENIDAGHPIMERNERTGRKQVMKVKGLTGIN